MISPHQWINFIYNRTRNGIEHKKCLDILQGFTRKVIIKIKDYHRLTSNTYFSKLFPVK